MHFRLDNAPFFAYGVSADDVVTGDLISACLYRFTKIVSKSGNRTIRISSERSRFDDERYERLLAHLVAQGCSYEGMNSKLISITVPPEKDLDIVSGILNQENVLWESADPTYDQLPQINNG